MKRTLAHVPQHQIKDAAFRACRGAAFESLIGDARGIVVARINELTQVIESQWVGLSDSRH